MRRLLTRPAGHIARTLEWFGSGGRAFHEVIVSRELRLALSVARVRGQHYRPVADGDWEDPGAGQPTYVPDPERMKRILDVVRGRQS
jgi:hypothetical protein